MVLSRRLASWRPMPRDAGETKSQGFDMVAGLRSDVVVSIQTTDWPEASHMAQTVEYNHLDFMLSDGSQVLICRHSHGVVNVLRLYCIHGVPGFTHGHGLS